MGRIATAWRRWDGQLLLATLGLMLASGLAMASAAQAINPALATRVSSPSVDPLR